MPRKNFKTKRSSNIGTTRPMEYADEEQTYGLVEKVLGDRYFTVRTVEGVTVRARVRSKRKLFRTKVDDVVVLAVREFDEKNADIVWVYNADEKRRLKREGKIEFTISDKPSGDFIESDEDSAFVFDDI